MNKHGGLQGLLLSTEISVKETVSLMVFSFSLNMSVFFNMSSSKKLQAVQVQGDWNKWPADVVVDPVRA